MIDYSLVDYSNFDTQAEIQSLCKIEMISGCVPLTITNNADGTITISNQQTETASLSVTSGSASLPATLSPGSSFTLPKNTVVCFSSVSV